MDVAGVVSLKGGSMFKLSVRLKIMVGLLFSIVMLGLLFEHTIWASHLPNDSRSNHTKVLSLPTTITIPKAQDLFMPFILVVSLHSTVTWQNDDTIMHVVTTTAQQNNSLNPQLFSFHVLAGKRAQFTFSQSGLYHYYDTTTSSWNATLSRVAAHRGTPHFPLAMDGVIWVQGPISNLPTVAINAIPAGHDEFSNEFQAIRSSGSVTWHNFDEDPHFIGLVPGWSNLLNPIDIGLYRVAGTDDIPGGASTTVLFDTPGLYYYHCRNHTEIDPLTNRAQALPMSSEYPVPMEGFVLVLGS